MNIYNLSKQEMDVYNALNDRAGMGIACFEFYQLTGSTQPNARINGIRKKMGCICKHSKGQVMVHCPAQEHIVNDGNTTYLIRPKFYQPVFC